MEGSTEGVHGNKKNRRLRTWRLDAAMDAITALTIKGVARAILRLSWIRHGGDAVQCVFVMPRWYVVKRASRQVFPLSNLHHLDKRKTDAKRPKPRNKKRVTKMAAPVATGFWDACPFSRLPKSRSVATTKGLPS